MKRIIRIFLATLVIVAIGGGGYFFYQSRAAGTSTASTGSYTQVVQVKQGDLSSTISVVGQLAAEQSSSLAFGHMSGTAKLLTLGVQAGNIVTATQVLATIDAATYQQAFDQAKSDLQAAEETLADLKAPATALEIAQADAAVATAEKTLEQAKSDLADLSAPDLTSLENAVKDAEDNLKLLQIQSDLAERDSLAKSERDLRYTVNWYGRRIASLEAMTERNAEQTAEITTDQGILAAAQADLDRVYAQRELARQARADELAKDKVALADAQEALAKAKAGGDKLTLAQAQLAVHEAEVTSAGGAGSAAGVGHGRGCDQARDRAGGRGQEAGGGERGRDRAGRHAVGGAVRRHDPGDQRRRGRSGDGEHDRPDPGQPEDHAGGGVGGRDDDPAGERGADGDDHVRCLPGPELHGQSAVGAAARHTAGRRDGLRCSHLPDRRRRSGAAGGHDRERGHPGRAGDRCASGADDRAPADQRVVRGAGAEHD